ncbi:MAG: ATP-binding protein [Deltaproteobacteria bacterium]
MARLLDRSAESVKRAFGARGAFARCGLVEGSGVDQRDFERVLALNDRVAKALLEPHDNASSLRSALLTVAPAPCLSLDDFAHAINDVSIARDLLRRAVETHAVGVNILLFGPPGTGKTQLSRVLADSIGATLYEAGVRDDEGFAASRGERIGYLRLAHTMLSAGANAVVACDEFEDIFGADSHAPAFSQRAAGQKGFLNGLIEDNSVPTVWIGNDLGDISDSLLRRFAFVIELRSPRPSARERILTRHLGDLPLDLKWLRRVALDARVSPAHVSRLARVMALLEPSSPAALEQVATRVLDNSLDPRQPAARPAPSVEDYDLECLNAECDLGVVLRRLSEVRAGRILLHGESGTGKSALARHVADSLRMPLHAPSASDLLSPFIGMNERNMAEAFRTARSEGAILFLDEVDSFVTERKQAQRSWEVTGVNELLVQMESFEGILICATNLVENVDSAAFRRFDLKIRLHPLSAVQRARLFAATLSRLEPDPNPEPFVSARWPAALDRLDGLTVGDFATVMRRARLVPLRGAAELLARLTEELRLRPNGITRTSGFDV